MTAPPFLILTLPRSGSYHLVSLLDSAPDLICHGEIYKRERVELAPPLRAALGLGREDAARRDAMGAAFTRALEAAGQGKPVGFKAFPAHLRGLSHRRDMLFGPVRRRVILSRDPLAAHLSALRARATGRWVRKAGDPPDPPARIRYDPRAFEKRLEDAARLDQLAARMARQAPGGVHHIAYESLGDRAALGALLRFLGSTADPAALTSDRVRQHAGLLEDGVENPAEMHAHLRAIGYCRRAA